MYSKYLKYKSKYLALKKIYSQSGGTNFKFTIKIDKFVKEVFDKDIELKQIFISSDEFYSITNDSVVAKKIFDLYKANFFWNLIENSKKIGRSEFDEYKAEAEYILNDIDFAPFIQKWSTNITSESAQKIISKIIHASNLAFSNPDDKPDNLIEWLDDTISYLIRDIQTVRFGRDREAMKIKSGEDWRKWTINGIISSDLLYFLWIDRIDHSDYLIEIMSYLGLCAKIPDKENDSFSLIVPLHVTMLAHNFNYAWLPYIDLEYLSAMQIDKLVYSTIKFSCKLDYIFETIITNLLNKYSQDYDHYNFPKIHNFQADIQIAGSRVILYVNWKDRNIQCIIYGTDIDKIKNSKNNIK